MPNSNTFKNQGKWLGHKRRIVSKFERSREQAVRDWVGENCAASVFADLRPETPEVETLVDNVIKEFNLQEAELIDTLRANWPAIATAPIAAVSRPENLTDGTLVIAVKDSTWRFVLDRQQKPILLKHLENQFPGQIRAIRIVAS